MVENDGTQICQTLSLILRVYNIHANSPRTQLRSIHPKRSLLVLKSLASFASEFPDLLDKRY